MHFVVMARDTEAGHVCVCYVVRSYARLLRPWLCGLAGHMCSLNVASLAMAVWAYFHGANGEVPGVLQTQCSG